MGTNRDTGTTTADATPLARGASPDDTARPQHSAPDAPAKPSHPRVTMRMTELDVLRVLAACMVVFIHITSKAALSTPRTSFYFLANRTAAFAVPAFIAMSAGLAWGAPDRHPQRSHAQFMLRRLGLIVPQYVFWTTVYLVIGWLFLNRWPGDLLGALRRYGIALISGDAWYHLYFVPLVIVVYAVAPLARRLMARSPLALFLLCLGIAVACSAFIRPWPAPGTAADTYARGSLLLPYCALGAWYVRDREHAALQLRRWWPALILVGFAARLWLAGWASMPKVATDVVGLGVMGVELAGLVGACYAFSCRTPLLSRWLGHELVPLTYGVFLTHPLVLLAFFSALGALGWPNLWFNPTFTLVSYVPALLMCFGFVWLLRTNPVTKTLT